jgi:soluble lytic murein transglycosylase-like protein
MNTFIMYLILSIAVEVGVPPYFVLAIALEENPTLDPLMVSPPNRNGTVDLGVMQLNSQYFGNLDWRDPETNIRAACQLIKEIMAVQGIGTYWTVAICYNAGTRWFVNNEKPPDSSIDYGGRVMVRWNELDGRNVQVIIRGKI